MATIQLKTFAWVREAVGDDDATCPLPEANPAPSLADLLDALGDRDPAWQKLLQTRRQDLCFAVNHKLCGSAQTIQAGDEVAIFPPITGG